MSEDTGDKKPQVENPVKKEPWEKMLGVLEDAVPKDLVRPGFFDLENLPMDESGHLSPVDPIEMQLKSGNAVLIRSNYGSDDKRFYSRFEIKYSDPKIELIHERAFIVTPSPKQLGGSLGYDKLTFKGQVGNTDNDNPDVEERVGEFLGRMKVLIAEGTAPNPS